jgi:tripartite-type tricarboxylate transporter receptor subunit TctC
MRFRLTMGLAALAAALGSFAPPAAADDFYQGKTLTILVGFSPGGGFDMNARLLARHIGRYIPGHPTVIVENAPGAGSQTAVMRLDVNLPTDGTVIDTFNFGLIGDSVLQPDRVKIDLRKYAWIGSISEDLTVCYLWHDGGPTTIAAMKGHHFDFGATGFGTSEDLNTKILRRVFDLDITQAAGYSGSAPIRIAIEQGELSGDCGAWSSLPPDWPKSPKFHPLYRTQRSVPPGMSASMPYILDIVPNDSARKVVRFLLADSELGRPFIASHAVPADRIRILRQAFAETVKDKDFLAEAERLRLPVSPRTGEQAVKIVNEFYATPPDIIDAARKIVAQ